MDTKALRQKILDLAIRGKLVPQDPNDEPAEVLLERIREQKQQMFKEGKLKKKDIKNDTIIFKGEDNLHYEKFDNGTVKCIEEEIPFDEPEGWSWVRLGDIGQYKKGPFGSSITKAMFVPDSPTAVKVYEQKNAINKDDSLGNYFISEEKYQSLRGFEVFPNDIIVSCAGTIGETYVLPKGMRKGIINQALMKISLYDLGMLEFYLVYFDFQLKASAQEHGHGIALKNIPPFDVLKKYLMPVPPLQEQSRIIRELASILQLLNAIDADRADISDLITRTKEKVLDLAIRGKLVPQNPEDEPAAVLVERIRAEKEMRIKQGTIKRDKRESIIFRGDDNSYYLKQGDHVEAVDSQFLFDLPDGWSWCLLPNISHSELGKTLDQAKNTGDLRPYLRSVNIRWDEVDLSDVNQMRFEPEEIDRYTITKGDLLICEGGDVGRSAIWISDNDILYQNALHRVRFWGGINPRFFMYYMMFYESKGIIKDICKGVTIKHLTGNVLNSIPFALPPVDEQIAIVAKIDEAFKLLNTIL